MQDTTTIVLGKRAAAKLATRKKIIESARHCFHALGYEASTMRDIAVHAGLSTGAIFANFVGKDDLWEEVYGIPYVRADDLLLRARQILQRMPRASLSENLAKDLIRFLEDSGPSTQYLRNETEEAAQ